MDGLDSFDALGPAEKHVAQQIRTAVAAAKDACATLQELLDELDLDVIEDVMLDSKRKTALIGLVDPLQKLGSGLVQWQLTPMVAKLFFEPTKTEA